MIMQRKELAWIKIWCEFDVLLGAKDKQIKTTKQKIGGRAEMDKYQHL